MLTVICVLRRGMTGGVCKSKRKAFCVRCVARKNGVGGLGEGARVKDCDAPAIKAAALSAGSNTTVFAITVLEIPLGWVFVEAMSPVDAPNLAVKVNPQTPK